MTKIAKEATMILDHDDVADILTDNLCSYNALAGLRVEGVETNDAGDFVLTLTPKPEQQPAVKAAA